MHSRSVLCMTGHYNFYHVCMYCTENQGLSIVIDARDTDVLVLLLAHFHKMPSDKVWLKAG